MSFRSADRQPESVYGGGFTSISLDYESATNNIIFEGAGTSFQLMTGPGNPTRTTAVASWELRNHNGTIIASGGTIPLSQTTWTPPSTLPCGWYRLYFRNGSGGGQGGGCFVVTRNVTGMPNNVPLAGDSDNYLLLRMLYPGYRLQIQDVNNRAADAFTLNWQMSATSAFYHPFDTARPKKHFCAFPNGTWGSPAAVSATVAAYPTIDYWESRNEPPPYPNAYWITEAAEFYTAVHAGRARAIVIGPCPVGFTGPALPYLTEWFAAGGANHVDALSFHTYGAHDGDLRLGRRSWDAWVALLTTYGAHTKPRVNTEAGGFMAAEYGAGNYIRQARQIMLDLMLNEQYGVPKERWWYFYAKSHGFNDYPSWLTAQGGQPYAAVATMLTYSQELIGTTYEARHDFGTIDNDFVIGSSFRRADSTGVVVVLGSQKASTPVTYQVSGGSPASIVAIDAWGNQAAVPVVDGLVAVDTVRLPTYLRLPAGVTLTPVATGARYGTSQMSGASASCSTGSYGATDIATTLAGIIYDLKYWAHDNIDGDQFSGATWQSGSPFNSAPSQTYTVTFPTARQVSKFVIRCPIPSGEGQCTILTADIEAEVGGAWMKVGEIDEDPILFEWLSTQYDAVDGYYDSFWEDNCCWEIDFPPATVTGLRIVVSKVSYGGNLNFNSHLAFDNRTYAGAQTVAGYGNWYPRLALQRVTAFDAPYESPLPTDPPQRMTFTLRMG